MIIEYTDHNIIPEEIRQTNIKTKHGRYLFSKIVEYGICSINNTSLPLFIKNERLIIHKIIIEDLTEINFMKFLYE